MAGETDACSGLVVPERSSSGEQGKEQFGDPDYIPVSPELAGNDLTSPPLLVPEVPVPVPVESDEEEEVLLLGETGPAKTRNRQKSSIIRKLLEMKEVGLDMLDGIQHFESILNNPARRWLPYSRELRPKRESPKPIIQPTDVHPLLAVIDSAARGMPINMAVKAPEPRNPETVWIPPMTKYRPLLPKTAPQRRANQLLKPLPHYGTGNWIAPVPPPMFWEPPIYPDARPEYLFNLPVNPVPVQFVPVPSCRATEARIFELLAHRAVTETHVQILVNMRAQITVKTVACDELICLLSAHDGSEISHIFYEKALLEVYSEQHLLDFGSFYFTAANGMPKTMVPATIRAAWSRSIGKGKFHYAGY